MSYPLYCLLWRIISCEHERVVCRDRLESSTKLTGIDGHSSLRPDSQERVDACQT
jgi:hypothetical protein